MIQVQVPVRPARLRFFRFAALLLLGLVLPQLMAPSALAKETWINLQTQHFNLVSNASEGETRKLALKLEQFRSAFSQIFNIQASGSSRITVVVFRDDSSFTPYKPLYKGKPANLAGYFHRSENENIVAINVNGNELHPLRVIFHEYTHVLTGHTPRPLPIWLTEGLAEYYSTFEAKDDDNVLLGIPVVDHVRLLRASPLIPLKDLFRVDTKSPAYNERDKQGIFYAESWALVHYLGHADNGAHHAQLVQFNKLYASGMDGEKAFFTAFGQDLTSMENALRDYIAKHTFVYFTVSLDNPMRKSDLTVRPLAEAEVRFYQGTLLLHLDRIDEAVALFKQSGQLDTNSPRSYEGLAFAAVSRGDFQQAAEHFKEAIARGSQSQLAHYYYAEGAWRAGGGVNSLSPEASALVTAELKQAIKLDPSFARAYFMLGQAYLFAGDHLEEGIEAEKAAIRLDPENSPRFALILAQLQLRLGKDEDARRTLLPLTAPGATTEFKERAQQVLDRIDARAQRRRSIEQQPGATADKPASSSAAGDSAGGRGQTPDFSSTQGDRFEGTQPMSGVLAAIECSGKSISLVLRADGNKVIRFSTSDPSKLRFYTSSVTKSDHPKIACGPINRAAVIHFKPSGNGRPETPGEAVAIEFKD